MNYISFKNDILKMHNGFETNTRSCESCKCERHNIRSRATIMTALSKGMINIHFQTGG